MKRKKDSWPQSADETTRAIVAEREGLDAASNIPHVGMSQPHGCFCVLIEAFEGLRVTHFNSCVELDQLLVPAFDIALSPAAILLTTGSALATLCR